MTGPLTCRARTRRAMIASTSPSMSWRSASTSGSRPCSRSLALVTGPMLTSRGRVAEPRRPADREQEAHGRGGGEGHVVGAADRRELLLGQRLDHGLVQRQHVDLGAARRAAHRARRRGPRPRARHQCPRHRHAPERLDQPLGHEPLRGPHRRSRRGAQRRRRPGADRGDRAAPASARASSPAAADARTGADAVGAGQADQVVARRASGAGRRAARS